MNTQNLPEDPSSTTATTRREAQEVGNTGVEAGQHVASVAKDQAQNVAQEVGTQTQNLVGEFGNNLREQAGTQQQKVAEGLRSISDELRSMAENNSESSGTATQWVHKASRKSGDIADWLEQRDPGSLLEEVKRFARRRPGACLGIATAAGLVAGRLTRGLGEGMSETGSGGGQRGTIPGRVPPTPDYRLTGAGRIGTPVTGQPPSPLDIETGESYGAPVPGTYGTGIPSSQPGVRGYGTGIAEDPAGTGAYGSGIAPGVGPGPETVYPPAPPEFLPEAAPKPADEDPEGRLP